MKEIKATYKEHDKDRSLESLIRYYIPFHEDLNEVMPNIGRKIVLGGCGEIDCQFCKKDD
jgi:hypothetical protein